MYKLYGYVPNLKLIKASFDEGKIIRTLASYIDKFEHIHFIIIKVESDRMIPYRIVLSEDEFYDYLDDYEHGNLIRKKVK